LTYAKASGRFVGAPLGSATLEPAKDANKRLCGKDVTATEIFLENAVKANARRRAVCIFA